MRNLIRALRGKPVELSPQQEAKMAKAQAKADAMIAEREEAGRQAQEEAARFMGSPPQSVDPSQPLPPVRDMFKQAFERARDSFGEMFDDRAGIIGRPEGADMNRPPPEVEDPAERERIAAEERAARRQARAPYLAPTPPVIERTRFATTGRTQFDDVVARLRGAAPERVYGVYRVPDRGELNRNSENKVALEWEIAHAPGALAGTTDVTVTAFNREVRWVARRPGEPSVLDEDVAGTLCARAGLQPEDCFGLPRLMQVRGSDSENGKFWRAHVDGVLVLARASESLGRAYEEMLAEAPIALPAQPVLPFHAEILDWEAVAAWVAPDRHGPPRTPSPLPHLPSTWEELTDAYLEIVGVRSEDCYGVQVTRAASDGSLADLSLASARKNLSGYDKLIHAAEHVVIAYRDRDEYREGRDRWRAYQHEVLDARLDHRTGSRPPLEADDHPRQSFLSEVFDFVNPLDPLNMPPQIFNRNERPSLGPYCGKVED